ncbi:MAG: 3-deoxy-D-manno-octulosonic acid transferase [Desulfobulbaceae bacterium]
MILVYNFLQAFLLIPALPLLLGVALCRKKYRSRIGARLGWGLARRVTSLRPAHGPTIWVHALSVGEVTSALPLVRAIRRETAAARIVFSATTSTGMEIAREKIAPHVDLVVSAPLDILPVTRRFTRLLRPDLFILVETDFWPNWLHSLSRSGAKLVLVNGRISPASFSRYRRFRFFFAPLFRSFSLLAMQTANDAEQIRGLGADRESIQILGNLKYDSMLPDTADVTAPPPLPDPRIPADQPIWICGSTHEGEEKEILAAYGSLRRNHPELLLIVAPRDPKRSDAIAALAADVGLPTMCRSRPDDPAAPILLLDTLGELADCYRAARVAFIGGSLVPEGGHNPLEAAAVGVPVLFGPHMEDFSEIARDLLACGGARTVHSAAEFERNVRLLLEDDAAQARMGEAGLGLVHNNRGVVDRHLRKLHALLFQASEGA